MMNYAMLPNLIMSMKEKVVKEVKSYATDVLYDICEIIKAMNDGSLPKEAYWITRDNGTEFGFADERMHNTLMEAYVKNNKIGILEPSSFTESCHCYRIDFEKAKIEEISAKEMIEAVERLCNNVGIVKDSGVYLKGFNFAQENGELEQLRESETLNKKCVDAIANAIIANTHMDDDCLHIDTEHAFKDVLDKGFSLERIAFITAANVYLSRWDERYSHDVRDWVNSYVSFLPDDVCRNLHIYLLKDRDDYAVSHPFIINNFAKQVIGEYVRVRFGTLEKKDIFENNIKSKQDYER